MLVYLDSVVCVYAVDGAPSFQARALRRLAAIRAAGDRPAISDLTWLECRVRPIRMNDTTALADIEAFLEASDVTRLPMPLAVYERHVAFEQFATSNSPTLCTWPPRLRAVVVFCLPTTIV